jgi:hypothetical protein
VVKWSINGATNPNPVYNHTYYAKIYSLNFLHSRWELSLPQIHQHLFTRRHGVSSQKTAIFIFSLRISDLSLVPSSTQKMDVLPKRQYFSARLHGFIFQTAVIFAFSVWKHQISHSLHFQQWTRELYNHRNVGTHAAHYAVSQHTRTQPEYSSLWQLQIFWNDSNCQLHPVHTLLV